MCNFVQYIKRAYVHSSERRRSTAFVRFPHGVVSQKKFKEHHPKEGIINLNEKVPIKFIYEPTSEC